MDETFKRSISRKLTIVVLTTTFTALLVAACAMLWYEVRSYQTTWIDDLTTQADILARVTAPALEFNDPKVAKENLAQLKARPNILAAAIYAPDGTLFATYTADQTASFVFPPHPGPRGHTIGANQVTIFHPVKRNKEVVGTVYLRGRYELLDRLGDYTTILVAVMAASLVVAALISNWLQTAITTPIIAVTNVAREVMYRRDFSLRVEKTTDDEIGVLVDAFNSMLREVGERARALEEANYALNHEMKERIGAEQALGQLNETLEARIAARTAELEDAHEQLHQAQKMEAVGQLTGGIAHDFNNLLAGMVGNIDMMKIRLSQGKTTDLSRYMDSAMSSIDRAAALTHRLLAFSRRQTLDPKPTDINQLIKSMEELLQRTVGPAIDVNMVLCDGLWRTLCDSNQLENALLNLVINACDAMPEGGKLTIETGNSDLKSWSGSRDAGVLQTEYVTVSVADTGTGMSQEVLDRAFDPFFTTKPLGQGTGLGLSMIYGFVNQSGGHIRINSEPDVGTTVKLHMPKYVGVAASGKIEEGEEDMLVVPVPRPTTASTVLIVDDEIAIRLLITEMLTELGYSVIQAPDGPHGLKILQSSQRIDLLVTDVGLPNGMNGRQLADAARVLRPELRILFITGYAPTASGGDGVLGYRMEVMTKPFKLEVFAAKVGRMMDTATVD
jgi:signal transduction histidine kinase/ActR/RegA family two-component response regulator